MCFINLQTAYDTVEGTLLRQVLTRIGEPPQMVAVSRHIHYGMGACVRPNGGVFSDYFEVGQRLRQGCMLSFNVVFTAVLTVILQRFNRDTVILVELAHLKKPPTSMGLEPGYGLRVSCGVMYAVRG